jgi:hypothetical protein
VQKTQKTGRWTQINAGISLLSFDKNLYYQTMRCLIDSNRQTQLHIQNGYAIVLLLAGTLTLHNSHKESVTMLGGETALLPYASFPLTFAAEANCDLVLIVPATAEWNWT